MSVKQEGGESRHYPTGSILIEMRDEWHRASYSGDLGEIADPSTSRVGADILDFRSACDDPAKSSLV